MRHRLRHAKVEVWVQMPDTLNITVVEDDDDAREALVDILELDRHRVNAFSTAESAVANAGFANSLGCNENPGRHHSSRIGRALDRGYCSIQGWRERVLVAKGRARLDSTRHPA